MAGEVWLMIKTLLSVILCFMSAFPIKMNISIYDNFMILSQGELEQYDKNTERVKQFVEKYFNLDVSEDKLFFYSKLVPYMSEEGIQTAMSQRLPVKYMDMLADNEIIYTERISITEIEDRLFDKGKLYHVEVELKKNTGKKIAGTVTGQVSMNAEGKIENVYFQQTPQFVEFLLEK